MNQHRVGERIAELEAQIERLKVALIAGGVGERTVENIALGARPRVTTDTTVDL